MGEQKRYANAIPPKLNPCKPKHPSEIVVEPEKPLCSCCGGPVETKETPPSVEMPPVEKQVPYVSVVTSAPVQVSGEGKREGKTPATAVNLTQPTKPSEILASAPAPADVKIDIAPAPKASAHEPKKIPRVTKPGPKEKLCLHVLIPDKPQLTGRDEASSSQPQPPPICKDCGDKEEQQKQVRCVGL